MLYVLFKNIRKEIQQSPVYKRGQEVLGQNCNLPREEILKRFATHTLSLSLQHSMCIVSVQAHLPYKSIYRLCVYK